VVRRAQVWAGLAVCGFVAVAASGQVDLEPHPVEAKLLADVSGVEPGATFTVGVLLTMEKGWHVYWRNPGDAGLATEVQWKLPKGFTAGPLRWPVPVAFVQPGNIVGYGYEHTVLLTARVTAPKDLPAGRVQIAAEASWLACKDVCLPGEASAQLELPVGGATTANQKLFAAWGKRLPIEAGSKSSPATVKTRCDGGGEGAYRCRVVLNWKIRPPGKLEWFPAVDETTEVSDVRTETTGRVTRIEFTVRIQAGRKPPSVLAGVVAYDDGKERRGVRVGIPLRQPKPSTRPAKPAAGKTVCIE